MSFNSSDLPDDDDLSEHVPNTLSSLSLPLLLLISHSHSPPLNPSPHLKFDVRSLPNPPKNVRDAYDGTSKRLQEWMRSEESFLGKRDSVKEEIGKRLEIAIKDWEKEKTVDQDLLKGEPVDDANLDSQETVESNHTSSKEDVDQGSITDCSDDEEEEDKQLDFRVGIFCAMGRHRSVAMVEELARCEWPGWRVEVIHRDIDKKRGAGKKFGGRQSRGTRGNSTHWEDLE